MKIMRLPYVFLLVLTMLVAPGCKDKGPVPDGDGTSTEAPKVGTTDATGAHPGSANPHAGTQNPHAGLDLPERSGLPTGKVDEAGNLDVGAIAFRVPDTWELQMPKSSMRRAQLSAPGDGGPAELVVYFFGPQGAGSAKENIDRWVGQFSNADGSPVTESDLTSSKVGSHEVTRLEVAGQYSNTMAQPGGTADAISNQRLIAAIVYTAGGPYYFKFLGPDATVKAQRGTFDALLESIVAAP